MGVVFGRRARGRGSGVESRGRSRSGATTGLGERHHLCSSRGGGAGGRAAQVWDGVMRGGGGRTKGDEKGAGGYSWRGSHGGVVSGGFVREKAEMCVGG